MWFVYDPEEGFDLYESEEEAKAAFEKALERYRKEAILDEWDTDVERLCMGWVTHEVELLDVTPEVLADRVECGMASEGDVFMEAFVKEVS